MAALVEVVQATTVVTVPVAGWDKLMKLALQIFIQICTFEKKEAHDFAVARRWSVLHVYPPIEHCEVALTHPFGPPLLGYGSK